MMASKEVEGNSKQNESKPQERAHQTTREMSSEVAVQKRLFNLINGSNQQKDKCLSNLNKEESSSADLSTKKPPTKLRTNIQRPWSSHPDEGDDTSAKDTDSDDAIASSRKKRVAKTSRRPSTCDGSRNYLLFLRKMESEGGKREDSTRIIQGPHTRDGT